MVLLVIGVGENQFGACASGATALLSESKAHVGAVFEQDPDLRPDDESIRKIWGIDTELLGHFNRR